MHSPLVITCVAVAAHLVGAGSQGTSGVITGQTDDATKTWKPNEEERVPFQFSGIAETVNLVEGESLKTLLDRLEKIHNAERLFDPTYTDEQLQLLIAASNYEINNVVDMVFAKLGSTEETMAKEVLQALTRQWHEHGVHPDKVYHHFGLQEVQLDKNLFTSPRYAELDNYVSLFNVGKPKEQHVSTMSLVWSNKIEYKSPEEKKKVAGVFYSYLQTKVTKNEDLKATYDRMAYLSRFLFI